MIAFKGALWRFLFADHPDAPAPTRASEGRFHHSGRGHFMPRRTLRRSTATATTAIHPAS